MRVCRDWTQGSCLLPPPTSNRACHEGAGRSRPGTASPRGQSWLKVLICIPGGEGAPSQSQPQQPLILGGGGSSPQLPPRSGSDTVRVVGTKGATTFLLTGSLHAENPRGPGG